MRISRTVFVRSRGAPDAPPLNWSTLTLFRARQATCPALQRLPVQIPPPPGPMQTVRPTTPALTSIPACAPASAAPGLRIGTPPVSAGSYVDHTLGKRSLGAVAPSDLPLEGPLRRVCRRHPTSARDVIEACRAVCARDPVVSGKGARTAAAAGHGVTSAVKTAALRRWEVTKLAAVLPASAMAGATGLAMPEFAARQPADIAQYLFAKAGAVAPSTIAQARCALVRLLRHLHCHGVPWEDEFGRLGELDLFGFLMSVHTQALSKASDKQPGSDAVWGAWKGLHYLAGRFRLGLPTEAVKAALPVGGSSRGRRALLQGAAPLPPEALAALFPYICDASNPTVLRSWAFALAFSTVSSLRQANAQNISFYGELRVLGRDYLLCQHADPKSKGKQPTVFVTPLQDFAGSMEWYVQGRALLWPDGDFLWADVQGDPRSSHAKLLPCPLDPGRIQWAIQLVLQSACGMTADQASVFTKHSARKTLVSAAQVAGCPWEQCIELGHWAGSALDSSFLLPQEDLRRKKALECMSMPKRYSADARLRRVARIVGNQMERMASYLRSRPPSLGEHAFRTLWALMPPYDKSREGA